jgi:hypothetical protein
MEFRTEYFSIYRIFAEFRAMSSIATVIRRTIKNFRIRRGKNYKSVVRQIWENIMLILRVQLEPHEYYLFNLYPKKVNKNQVIHYLNSAQFSRDINPVLNPPEWHYILNDKVFFNRYYSHQGLPVAHQYGFLSRDFSMLSGGGKLSSREDLHEFLLKERPGSIVLKPHDTFGGYGIMVFQDINYNHGIVFRSSNGSELDFDTLADKIEMILEGKNPIRGYILEEAVEQHPYMQEIYPHSVNTLRIITYLTKDNLPKIIGTRMRMGRNGTLVDNISQGGIHGSIDPATGKITGGFSVTARRQSDITEHPDTRVRFPGREIPFWQQVVDLCQKAASVTPFQRFVGWDIAIGKNGPILIEGNSDGVEVSYDQINRRGFITEEFRRDMQEYGIHLPERLPGFSPRRIYQSYKISRRMQKIG